MSEIRIKFDFSKLVKLPKALKAKLMDEWMGIALRAYGLTLERMVVLEIQRRNLSVTGDLMGSIVSRVSRRVGSWMVRVGTNLRTQSGYPYPVGVHEGTIPHFAPIEPLIKYVEKKFGEGGKEKLRHAYALRGYIAKQGTQGHPFMQAIFTKERPYIESRISYELGRVIAQKGGKIV